MDDGSDPIGDYEPDSFEDDYLSRLDVDTDQLDAALQDLDEHVAAYDEDVTLEIAETSYADAYWETDVDHDRDHGFFVVYLDRDLDELQQEMPDSVFDRFDSEGEVHDLYVEDVVLRLITGEDHDVVEILDNEYDAIDIGKPSEHSVYTQWADQQA